MAKGFGVSPITNTIYHGTQDPIYGLERKKMLQMAQLVLYMSGSWGIWKMIWKNILLHTQALNLSLL